MSGSVLRHILRRSCRVRRLITLIGAASLLIWLVFLVVGGDNPTFLFGSHQAIVHRATPHTNGNPAGNGRRVFSQGLDDLMPSPLLRRGPVPNVLDFGEAKPDDENVAREVIDARDNAELKSDNKIKLDDNAAREEHSGEALVLREKNTLQGFVRNNVTNENLNAAHDEQEYSFHQLPEHQKDTPEEKYGAYNNWRNLTTTEINRLSVLGRRMFLNEKIGQEQDRIFTIHIWKYVKHIEKRLLKKGSSVNFDPLEDCSVSNCRVTTEDGDVEAADIVLFHLHRIKGPPVDVPRAPGQIWVWMSDESPYNVFMVSSNRVLSNYNGFFNWSMTYRMDSNVPVPYGRTVPLPKDQYLDKIDDYYKIKQKNISILGSNCGGINGRYKYIAELQKYIEVDVYGGCGPLKCPGHFHNDCDKLNDYKFYLAFENSNCDGYITEKVWWNALNKAAVPVVMGPPKRDYEKLLPPKSFIHVDDFKNPEDLARYLTYLLNNPAEYQKYHDWRRRYRVLNEHGYFQSPVYHICRLCEALNYNDKKDQRADLEHFFDRDSHCYPGQHWS
ncbi:4-galactosyl-N-acetylglucosaminide 3-alpha-L-fucosyltransferase 9-like [Hyalella azteca]|uniref:Fucosyltransferase n=2 Tax=Hyalella azteca TaxID=294128 RepID=A0A8B7NZ10_HYAAZ|nr:4-galactosyl-N-acetylglucosaminide 3-alpha-L-fucosyltransferase 9-like [Hyalella azteca]